MVRANLIVHPQSVEGLWKHLSLLVKMTSAPLSPDAIEQALNAQVVDKEGRSHQFGDLVQGRRTAVVFVRHWCEHTTFFSRDSMRVGTGSL